jgi:hypothetical protein
MSREKPDDDPRNRSEEHMKSGTDTPWKRPNQAAQDPSLPEPSKPDLEQWQRTETH